MAGVFRHGFTVPAPVQAPGALPKGNPVVVPSVQPAYSDRSIANHFVSQYNGRVVRSRKARKPTAADLRYLFKAGLAVGRARQRRRVGEEE